MKLEKLKQKKWSFLNSFNGSERECVNSLTVLSLSSLFLLSIGILIVYASPPPLFGVFFFTSFCLFIFNFLKKIKRFLLVLDSTIYLCIVFFFFVNWCENLLVLLHTHPWHFLYFYLTPPFFFSFLNFYQFHFKLNPSLVIHFQT